jgi:hypothetical protein
MRHFQPTRTKPWARSLSKSSHSKDVLNKEPKSSNMAKHTTKGLKMKGKDERGPYHSIKHQKDEPKPCINIMTSNLMEATLVQVGHY